jgi:hypothetical protein
MPETECCLRLTVRLTSKNKKWADDFLIDEMAITYVDTEYTKRIYVTCLPMNTWETNCYDPQSWVLYVVGS